MLKFIVDTQLPPRLARFLSAKGHDAIHTSFFPDGHLFNDQYIVQIALQEAESSLLKTVIFLITFSPKGLHLKFCFLNSATLTMLS
jgi:hypothetical protein